MRVENVVGISEFFRVIFLIKVVDFIGKFCLMRLLFFYCKINKNNVLLDILIRIENSCF